MASWNAIHRFNRPRPVTMPRTAPWRANAPSPGTAGITGSDPKTCATTARNKWPARCTYGASRAGTVQLAQASAARDGTAAQRSVAQPSVAEWTSHAEDPTAALAELPGSQQVTTRVIPAFDAFVCLVSRSPMFQQSNHLMPIATLGSDAAGSTRRTNTVLQRYHSKGE